MECLESIDMKVIVPADIVKRTIEQIQIAGEKTRECMVLWLGERDGQSVTVRELLVPIQIATRVSLDIPRSGVEKIFDELRKRRYMIAAQVHSHPHDAFHSEADDCLALPRHEGAISLVLPEFGLHMSLSSFLAESACYRLSRNDVWEEAHVRDNVEILY